MQTRRKSGDALLRGHIFHADAALLHGTAAIASLLREHGHLLLGKPPAGGLVGYRLICFSDRVIRFAQARTHTHKPKYVLSTAQNKNTKKKGDGAKSRQKKKKRKKMRHGPVGGQSRKRKRETFARIVGLTLLKL